MPPQNQKWELVREFGLEYSNDSRNNNVLGLIRPIVADCLPGGGYLIVDEYPGHGAVGPGHMNCRTLILSPARAVVYDSTTQGMKDEFGCRMDEQHVAILCRTRCEIKILLHTGECAKRIPLPALKRNDPQRLSWTHCKTFLINFFSQKQPFNIVEIDYQGRLLWSLSPTDSDIKYPVSMQLLSNDSILIANVACHVVEELRRDGSTLIRWGVRGKPSSEHGQLCNPKWAQQLDDGTLLIADAHNHRCLEISPAGLVSEIGGKNEGFFSPSCVTRQTNSNYMICDWGLPCIYELDDAKRVIWNTGGAVPRKRHLSFPRSVNYLNEDRYLIADTGNNRIVDYDGRKINTVQFRESQKLSWPRAVRKTSRGTTVLADGLNSRVLEISVEGRALRQLGSVSYRKKSIALMDPHDVRELPNGNLLITDAALDLVLETDWNGDTVWAIGIDGGLKLNDPHSAQLLPDGRVMISDTGHDRILLVDPATGKNQSMTGFLFEETMYQLRYPRYSELSGTDILIIVDTLNNRVLAVSLSGKVHWVISHVPNSPIPNLQYPRWAHLISRDEIVISDHLNHRIVHLRRGIG